MAEKLLITGCSGLIGKILWDNLSDSFELYGLDRKAAAGNNVFQADITVAEQVAGGI